MPPGCGLLISEIFLDEDRGGPSRGLLQALSMSEGKQRSATEYSLLLKSNGFITAHVRHTDNFLDAMLCIKVWLTWLWTTLYIRSCNILCVVGNHRQNYIKAVFMRRCESVKQPLWTNKSIFVLCKYWMKEVSSCLKFWTQNKAYSCVCLNSHFRIFIFTKVKQSLVLGLRMCSAHSWDHVGWTDTLLCSAVSEHACPDWGKGEIRKQVHWHAEQTWIWEHACGSHYELFRCFYCH